jgi:hypothetical protein
MGFVPTGAENHWTKDRPSTSSRRGTRCVADRAGARVRKHRAVPTWTDISWIASNSASELPSQAGDNELENGRFINQKKARRYREGQLYAKSFLKKFSVLTTKCELPRIREHDLIVPIDIRREPAHSFQIDDGRAMDTAEVASSQVVLQL